MDGKREGSGEFVGKDGERYTGEWKNDKKHGRGNWRSRDGDTYDGEFHNDWSMMSWLRAAALTSSQ